jgi:hypothetical protein
MAIHPSPEKILAAAYFDHDGDIRRPNLPDAGVGYSALHLHYFLK